MNKIYKFAALLSVSLMAFAGCAPEELSTDQLSDEFVTFAAMAPNPVARGGALRIQGSNLDKVVEVRIPGVEPITDIIQVDSLKGRLSEIRVIVPVDGPEVGKVVIVDQDGNEFTSHSDLTYSEPIIFTSFSTENEVAMPGDVVTIKGDYMNNIRTIQFGTSAPVTTFVEQSRYELKVVLPADAVTGKVILCDVDENNNPDGKVSNLFYSEKDLTIGKPTIDKKERGVLKAGESIKVTGKYLQMINKAQFKYTSYDADGNPVDAFEAVDFVLAEDQKSVTAVLSTTVSDGELLLYSYAGDEFSAGSFQTLVPSDLKHTAAKGYKAGNEIVISGKDLDLVTELTIGESVTTFTYKENKITATILGTSKDGKITVKLANGKTVDAEDGVTFVKPTITGISILEFFVPDQKEVVVSGTDLDLVKTATLGGRDIEFEYKDEKIILKPSITAVSGKVLFILENGVTVESTDEITVKYHSLVVVTEMTSAQHIGMEVVIKGTKMDLIENIFIGDEKVTQYALRTPDEVRFLMPWLKVGMYDVHFHLFNGDIETQATKIEVKLELNTQTIWEGEAALNWSGMTDLSWGGYDWSTVKPGTVLTAYFTLAAADYWQIRFGNGSWASIPSGIEIAGGEGNIALTPDATYYAITLTAADIDMLVNQGGLVMTGANYTITKLTLTSEIPQETTVWEGNQDLGAYDLNYELKPNDMFVKAGLKAGQKLRFYITPKFDYWSIQLFDGHWGQLLHADLGNQPSTENGDVLVNGAIEIDVTEDLATKLTTLIDWGYACIIQGNCLLTKITIL